jgi:hypothetical protein
VTQRFPKTESSFKDIIKKEKKKKRKISDELSIRPSDVEFGSRQTSICFITDFFLQEE